MSFDPSARTLDVPDPYYAGPGMFDEVLGMIESASRALFRQLEPAIRPSTPPSPPAAHRSDLS
jgi:protein-tyrosine phosphatase